MSAVYTLEQILNRLDELSLDGQAFCLIQPEQPTADDDGLFRTLHLLANALGIIQGS